MVGSGVCGPPDAGASCDVRAIGPTGISGGRGGAWRELYSMHAPEVECIGKGKAHKPYEFGVKVSVATPLNRCRGGQFVAHVKALPGHPYDGHTLAAVLPDLESTIDAGFVGSAPTPGTRATTHRTRALQVYVRSEARRTAAIKRGLRSARPGAHDRLPQKRAPNGNRDHLAGRPSEQPTPSSRPWATTSASPRWLALLLRIVLAVLAAASQSKRTIVAS